MVGKQVIIDGCDVAGCEYLGLYKECKLKCGGCCTVDCKDNPNCYYKQLKRKEQECKVIVADAEVTYTHLEHRIEMCDLLGKSLKAKEQECEELEEANNTLTVTREKLLGDLCIVEESLKDYTEHYNRQSEELDQLKKTNKELKKENEELRKCYKNNSTLLDFEETNTTKLVNKVMKLKQTLIEIKEITETCSFTDSSELLLNRIKQILQKIRECEV